MDWVRATPKIIYSLWLQGESEAPNIARVCFDRWARLNPNYELRIFDKGDVARLFEGSSIRLGSIPTVEALSDVVRARLLLESGGVWVDASLLPMRPLDAWLPEMLKSTGFFAFERPGHDRPIASWFLAAARDHVIMKRWWEGIERFWSRPRRFTMYESGLVPNDPVASVAPDRGGTTDEFPYFWFHYLFQHMIENNAQVADMWSRCANHSAEPAFRLQKLLLQSECPSCNEINTAASCAPVQKLSINRPQASIPIAPEAE